MSPKSDSRLNSTVSTLTSRTPNGATQRHNVYQRREPLALLVEVMTGLKGYYSRLCRRNTSPQSGLINIQSKPLSGWFLSLPASGSSFCAVLPNGETDEGRNGKLFNLGCGELFVSERINPADGSPAVVLGAVKLERLTGCLTATAYSGGPSVRQSKVSK